LDRAVYDEIRLAEQSHWWFVGRRRIIRALLDAKRCCSQGKILEIGCGTGGNLELLARYGEVLAVEPDAEARAVAAERSIGRVSDGSLPASLPSIKDVSLACLFDVLEHVEDDQAALKAVATTLKSDGVLLITVPAYQWLFGSHDQAHHHKRRYVLRELKTLVQRQGFSITVASYFNSFLFVPIALIRVLNKLVGKESRSDAVMPPPLLNAMLAVMFSLERIIVPWIPLPFGLSIVIMATKNHDVRPLDHSECPQ